MNYNAAVSPRSQPKFSEGSNLAISPRDDRNNSKLWKKCDILSKNQEGLRQQLQKTISVVSKQRRKPLGGGFPSTEIKTFQVVSDGGDYYNCYTFDGVTAGTQIIKVAKHQELRCILPTATPAGGAYATKIIRGVTYTYTYNAVAGVTADGVNVVEYTRDVTGSDSSAETDYITPCLNVGDIISAFQTTFAGPADLVDVTWQALADGRAWASL